MRRRDEFHAFQRLHAALRLLRFGSLRLETVDEALQMLHRLLLLHIRALLQRDLLRAQDFELAVIAAVTLDLPVLQMQRDVADGIEEFAIMRDHDQRSRIAMQPVFQPDDRIEIQVVRRFVQQQQVRAAHQRLRQVQAHAPAAGETCHGVLCLREREPQADQQGFGAGRRGVPVGVGERGVCFGFSGAIVGRRCRRNPCFDAP